MKLQFYTSIKKYFCKEIKQLWLFQELNPGLRNMNRYGET